ncbi:MAG: Flp pilus assembly protein CpaB, partial [Selenomonadaceae bacterium]|nr:Flp pilus assembly protein CpaB [Selenomonadaceae bacterium]
MLQKILNKLNDLRPKQLLMLAGATAILMFMVIYFGMSLATNTKEAIVQPEPEKKEVIQTTPVVVAKVNIPPRTRIQEAMLQMKELPVDAVPEGAITNFDDVKNVQIKVSIFAGDILTIHKVFNAKGDEGFVGEIPADCRAVSINVSEVTSVAGFAKPGDKVDLLLVEKDKYSATTNLILQNVPLLSVNQDMTGGNVLDESGNITSSAIRNPTIATFALPPQDVLKLISASKLGEIYMMLRPSNPRA